MTDPEPQPDEGPAHGEGTQLDLLPALVRRQARAARQAGSEPAAVAATVEPAPVLPVARLLVDVPLAHLDRPFDYLVTAKLDGDVRAGSRVKVRFAGQEVTGFVLERVAASDHPGRLQPLRRAVSGEPVLSPEIARLCHTVAQRYAGTRSDVLRLAVPPRHARVEKEPPREPAAARPVTVPRDGWSRYDGGAAYLEALGRGDEPHAVWSALPGEEWPARLAEAAAVTVGHGRGALLCVPDRKDVARVDAALTGLLGEGRHVVLTADLGPAARYRAFLAVARGAVQVVLGTRAAAFAPVRDLGMVALWDDGDDLHAEPRAPYCHTRELLLSRAQQQSTAALVGGFARTVEGEYLLTTGWAQPLEAGRAVVRAAAPSVAITGATDTELERDPHARSARLPRTAYDVIRTGLEQGPVLVQTPRRGYATALACATCREPARCRHCQGPLQQAASGREPSCRWCGRPEPEWTCPTCGGNRLRAPVVGERRTAEELGRAFPAVPVKVSGGDRVLAEVDQTHALVVATPGAEPVAAGGYAAVVLLDTWLMLARTDLRTVEESLRRWFAAAALTRSAAQGGRVVSVGDPADPALQALLRWDPSGFAARELVERQSAHLPPASRLATITGAADDVAAVRSTLVLPVGAEVLGPVETFATGSGGSLDDPGTRPVRLVVRVPRAAGGALSQALGELQRTRSARKLPAVRVQVDPVALE